jgi:hypothetical protein
MQNIIYRNKELEDEDENQRLSLEKDDAIQKLVKKAKR